MKILHIVGGSLENGAFKGAKILHNALSDLNIDSKILNDSNFSNKVLRNDKIISKIKYINFNFKNKILYNFYVYFEKILKSIYLHSPRETFTIGLFGFDLTKFKEYEEADLIHIHWLSQGFIRLKSLKKINKPVIWTMRDMWAFTGGSHYSMDFEKYEKSRISKYLQNYKREIFKKNFHFVAVSNWIKKNAESSFVLKNQNIIHIDNNIDIKDFKNIEKSTALANLKISTKKQIILYGAQNPQSKRKGWNIFVDSLKKLDKSKYFLLIFGNFWSQETLDKIEIEYRSLGYISDKVTLNSAYSCADIFVASSIQDAWPKTFAEAMYCGTPVVCFNNTSVSEIVDHKINGYVVEKFDENELFKGLLWLLEETKINNTIRQNSRTKILNYDSKIIAKKYINLYEKVCDNKKKQNL